VDSTRGHAQLAIAGLMLPFRVFDPMKSRLEGNEPDLHDIMGSLPPSGVNQAYRENGPGECGTPTRDL